MIGPGVTRHNSSHIVELDPPITVHKVTPKNVVLSGQGGIFMLIFLFLFSPPSCYEQYACIYIRIIVLLLIVLRVVFVSCWNWILSTNNVPNYLNKLSFRMCVFDSTGFRIIKTLLIWYLPTYLLILLGN